MDTVMMKRGNLESKLIKFCHHQFVDAFNGRSPLAGVVQRNALCSWWAILVSVSQEFFREGNKNMLS